MRILRSPITALSAALHLLVGAIALHLLRAQGWDGVLSAGIWLLLPVLGAPAVTVVIVLAVRRQAFRVPEANAEPTADVIDIGTQRNKVPRREAHRCKTAPYIRGPRALEPAPLPANRPHGHADHDRL